MNTHLEHYMRAQAATLQLTTEEKSAMREELRKCMIRNPHPYVGRMQLTVLLSRFPLITRFFSVALVAVFLLAGGTVYAAQSAQPGQRLYSVRTNINEPLAVVLALTPERKAQVQLELAKRRVAEAQMLAIRGELDERMSLALRENFNAHAAKAIAFARQADLGRALIGGAVMHIDTTAKVAAANATSIENGSGTLGLAGRVQISLTAQASLMDNVNKSLGFQPAHITSPGTSVATSQNKKTSTQKKTPQQVKDKSNTVYTATAPSIKVAPSSPDELEHPSSSIGTATTTPVPNTASDFQY